MAEQEASRAAHAHPIAAPAPEAWIKTELARHAQRPYPMDFIEALFTDFSEIHGDRAFGDDAAMSCGMAFFHGEPVLVVGNLKGRTLKERVARKFGSPDPEGYRKALRAMKIAEKFGHPIFTFIDLAGANPGIGAEERGQGEAIARNLLEMSRLRVPTIATITGEGGSGGALALAVTDRVLMLENCDLFGDLARGLRVDHVEGCGEETAGCRCSQIHRDRRPTVRLRRRRAAGAGGGNAERSRRGHGDGRRKASVSSGGSSRFIDRRVAGAAVSSSSAISRSSIPPLSGRRTTWSRYR